MGGTAGTCVATRNYSKVTGGPLAMPSGSAGETANEGVVWRSWKGQGLIAAATSPTVDDYATTGVSGQENVLFLF